MEERPQTLPERKLGDLLNETFAIYGRHFWRLIALVAVIQVPITLLTLVTSGNMAAFVGVGVVSVVSNGIVHGALAFAVGQNYVREEVRIAPCYSRVAWRLVSLVALSVVPAVMLAIVLGLLFVESPAAVLLIVPLIGLIVYMVYWTIAVPSVIVEGFKPVKALERSFGLVQGSWWRVFGISLVFGLVAVGLGILLSLPFLIAGGIASPDPEQTTALSTLFEVLGSLVSAVTVPPVAFVGGTLLYYDLRVRKEDYNFETLSREMGVVSV